MVVVSEVEEVEPGFRVTLRVLHYALLALCHASELSVSPTRASATPRSSQLDKASNHHRLPILLLILLTTPTQLRQCRL